jgi:hypothetical protein
MKNRTALLFALSAWMLLGGCRDDTTTVCPAMLYVEPTRPLTTTLKVGVAIIATAGYAYEACAAAPPPDFIWIVSDTSIAAVFPIDSVRAQIKGLRPGITLVTPTYRHGQPGPTGVLVTVNP